MSKHRKGYSVFSRGKTFTVAWVDGSGNRKTKGGFKIRKTAEEVGRSKANDADRVRGGVVSIEEQRVTEARRENVAHHVKKWQKVLRDKGNTETHVQTSTNRVTALFRVMGTVRLVDLQPEKVQTALAEIGRTSSPNTARHYLTALRGFVKWCMETDKLLYSPIRGVKRPTIAGDTFTRRPISIEEFGKLLIATRIRKAKAPIHGVERARFYEVLANTGFRKGEALSLVPESFALDGDDPFVVVAAAYSKRRRRDEQLVSPDFAASIRPWLATKEPRKPIFAFPRRMGFERIFRGDCKAAGITVRGKKGGEILGLHSLRRLAITSVGRAAGLAVAQTFARHSTPTLTKKYMDLTSHDLRKGLSGLPKVTEETGMNGTRSAVAP